MLGPEFVDKYLVPGQTMSDPLERPVQKITRVLVVDDFVSMHEALTSCLGALEQLEVVGTALNGKEALEKVSTLKPDLAIVDLQMPVMDGFQLMRHLRRDYPQIRLVAVCGHASAAIEAEAIAAGAHAFVAKASLPQGLLNKVEAVLLQ
jgi:two-component system, chemotaxis family, protein-glutamate methylesterase/glutaminase